MTTPASIQRPDVGRWAPYTNVRVKQVHEMATP